MKILFVCNEYPPSKVQAGIGTFVHIIAHGLSKHGHDVTVVGLTESSQSARDGYVRVFSLKRNRMRYVGNLISRLRLREWITAYVRAGCANIVEAPDSEGLMAFGIRGCVLVTRLHGSKTVVSQATGRKASRGISLYERLSLTRSRNWIAVSEHILNLTRTAFGISPLRSAVIHNPFAPAQSHPSEALGLPDDYVLYAGLVTRRKGADTLAIAAKEFLVTHPNVHLVYAGGVLNENGRPFSEVISGILGPSLTARVHFLGHVDRTLVLECMARAKAFAFPSRIESCGLVVLEAMGCGTPVVFTKQPPGPEIIEDGVTGLLADANSPSDFSEKICRLLDSEGEARRLAENARKAIASRFSVEKCVEETEQFYRQCMAEPTAAPSDIFIAA